MTLKEYTTKLLALMASRPETEKFPVVTSKDDEGNGFTLIHYDPSVGNYSDGEFSEEVEANAVCVN